MLKVSHTFCSCPPSCVWTYASLVTRIRMNNTNNLMKCIFVVSYKATLGSLKNQGLWRTEWVDSQHIQSTLVVFFLKHRLVVLEKRSGTYFHSGNLAMLKEKINSIPFHLSNRHFFPSNKHHTKCSHGELEGRAWLDPDSKVEFW